MHWSETVENLLSDLLFKRCLCCCHVLPFNSGSMRGFHKGSYWPWRVQIFPITMLRWGFLQWKESAQIISYIMTQFCRIVVIRVTISTIELIWTMVVLICTGIWGFQLKPLCPKWATLREETWTQSERERKCVCVRSHSLYGFLTKLRISSITVIINLNINNSLINLCIWARP